MTDSFAQQHWFVRQLRMWTIRGVLALVVAGLGVAMTAQSAQAQAPAKDEEYRAEQQKNLILRLGEWYAKVKEWRETALEVADSTISQTEQLKKLRENYEERAIGELGKLGEEIPDWRNYLNTCAVVGEDSTGVGGAISKICGDGKSTDLVSRYEEVLIDQVEKFEEEVFDVADSVDAQTDQLVREQAGELAETVIGEQGKAQLEPEIKAEAKHATKLDQVAAEVDSMLKMLVEKEVGTDSTGKKEISSGRANQMDAWIAWGEAQVALAELRASTASARRKAIERAETNREEQVNDWVILHSLVKP